MKPGVVVAALVSLALAACGSNSPVEVIVKPGITAIEQSSALACEADRLTLETAIENFTLLNVDPPAAESDLVPDWLRSESQLYDVVDGQVVPAPDSGCPAGTAATADPSDPAAAPPADPDHVSTCLARSKTLTVAIEAYYAMNGTSVAPTEEALVDAQLLRALDDAYDVDASGQVVATSGGTCDGIDVSQPSTTPIDVGECEKQHKVLEVAIAAYFTATGLPAASEANLLPDYLVTEITGYDVVDGAIVPAPASPCP